MKKRVLSASIAVLLSVFLCGCDEDLDAGVLIGMSRENVLRLAFAKCKKDKYGELDIGVWELEKNGKKSYQNYYYKSYEEAKSDPRLMNSNIWEIDKKDKFSFSIFQREECLLLTFEKDKVVKVEKTCWNKT